MAWGDPFDQHADAEWLRTDRGWWEVSQSGEPEDFYPDIGGDPNAEGNA